MGGVPLRVNGVVVGAVGVSGLPRGVDDDAIEAGLDGLGARAPAPATSPRATAEGISRMSARFTDHLRALAEPIWRAQHEHPFVRGIGDGTLAEDRFRHWIRQDYRFLIEYCRLFGLAAARAPTSDDSALRRLAPGDGPRRDRPPPHLRRVLRH